MEQKEGATGDDAKQEATAEIGTTTAEAIGVVETSDENLPTAGATGITETKKMEAPDKNFASGDKYDDMGARPRTFTEKGEQNEVDKSSKIFNSLQTMSAAIINMIEQKEPIDSIRAKHKLWMDKYETFIEHHQNIIPRIIPDHKETHINTYDNRNKTLEAFMKSMNSYFSAKSKENQKQEREERRSRSSKHSSSKVTSSSLHSSISAKRLKEEQVRAELEAKMAALNKRKEIELAKTKIKLEEEELEIQTSIAISDAKQKVLDKYDSEVDSQASSSTEHSRKLIQEKQNYKLDTDNYVQSTNLNVNAKPYTPQHVTRTEHKPSVIENTHRIDEDRPCKDTATHAHISSKRELSDNPLNAMTHFDNHESQISDMSSIVKHLRKPVPDIRKFGGDPLEFRKFTRQFTARVVANADTEEEKMTYLEQFTYGEANRVVSGFGQLNSEYAYTSAINQLYDRYGDDEVIANAFIKKALGWSDISSGDSEGLDEFSLFLTECLNAIESIDAIRILEYSENIKLLMRKLPLYLHDRWRNEVSKIKAKERRVKFSDFVEFVKFEAKKLNDPVYGKAAVSTSNSHNSKQYKSSTSKSQKPKEPTYSKGSFAVEMKPEKIDPKCSYCTGKHTIDQCKDILKLNTNERYEHLKSKGHCFGCLKIGHRTANCRNRLTCKICERRHPTLLHKGDNQSEKAKVISGSTQTDKDQHANPIISTTTQTGAGEIEQSCAMAIVPVKVKLKDKPVIIDTYAFFDPGSNISFCTEELMHRLGGSGKRMNIKVNTMGEPFNMNTYAVNGIQVMDFEMNNANDVVNLPKVYTKDVMQVSREHIPREDEISKWSHLSKVTWHSPDCSIGLMIGNNVPDAYIPFETATGPSGSPHGTRTRLGWIIWNMLRNFDGSDQVVNRAQLMSIQAYDEENNKLEQLYRNSLNYDFPERIVDDKLENSVEDKKFLELVNESVNFKNGHYEIGLPFRDQKLNLPNNASQGLLRLKGLKSKFVKNPKFRNDYLEFMKKLMDKGYMEIVPLEDLDRNDGRVWYLPHHGVYHAQKDKIRVVFDCSATYMGVSLNSQLLQGPNLTNNLLGVLLRFREERVAILGDIEAMFHQVQVPKTDRDCLRFFWWPNGDIEKEPMQYRMTVHLFGATSSPSCCNFAIKQITNDFAGDYDSSILKLMSDSMYVDDCLASVESEDQAIGAIRDITSLCKDGGFKMTKWISNVPSVIQSIPEDDRAKGIQHWDLEDDLPVERALGVQWNMETDSFGFKVTFKDKSATRRNILSIASSVYDPIGIISPYVLTAKSILQRLCKQGYSWDQEISGLELKQWNDWLSQLSDLAKVQLPRCYKSLDLANVQSCQLHCFSDASETGYGIVFYFRMIDNLDQISCAFVLGKSRVTPLKKITIPRLELTAAAKAVKLSKIITDESNYRIDKIVFWTDSMSVLRYIFNQKSRFHTFVANRLEIIKEATEPTQWKFVSTKENPADFASRGMKASQITTMSDWFNGPEFLRRPENEWPQYDFEKSITDNDQTYFTFF